MSPMSEMTEGYEPVFETGVQKGSQLHKACLQSLGARTQTKLQKGCVSGRSATPDL